MEEVSKRYLPGPHGGVEGRGIRTKGSVMEIHIYYPHFNVTLIMHLQS